MGSCRKRSTRRECSSGEYVGLGSLAHNSFAPPPLSSTPRSVGSCSRPLRRRECSSGKDAHYSPLALTHLLLHLSRARVLAHRPLAPTGPFAQGGTGCSSGKDARLCALDAPFPCPAAPLLHPSAEVGMRTSLINPLLLARMPLLATPPQPRSTLPHLPQLTFLETVWQRNRSVLIFIEGFPRLIHLPPSAPSPCIHRLLYSWLGIFLTVHRRAHLSCRVFTSRRLFDH